MLDHFGIKGFTKWTDVAGRGSNSGDPHMGTHTWPEMNSATLTVVEDDKVDIILDTIKKLDAINEEVGIRAFVWDIVRSV